LTRRIAVTVASLVPLLCGVCALAAAAPKEAVRYFTTRDKAKLVAGVTPQQLQVHGREYVNKVIEVKGVVTGSARRQGGGTVVVHASDSDIEYVLEVGAEVPEALLDTGQNVRILAKVTAVAGSSQPEIRAIAVVSEYDALQADQEYALATQQKRAEEARRTVVHRQLASRGTPANFRRTPQPPMTAIIERYRDAVLYFNHRLNAWEAERIARSIIAYSNRYGLDARLVMAVIACESNFNPNAVSRVGARGLGQLMPGTAAGLGVGDSFNAEENLDGATRLLRSHLDHMSGGDGHAPTIHEIQLALACYNAGAGAVHKYKGIPPYRETQNYVKRITRLYLQFCGAQ